MDVAFEGPISVAPRSIRSIPVTEGAGLSRGAIVIRRAAALVGHVGVYELAPGGKYLAAQFRARAEALGGAGRGGVARIQRVRELRPDGKSFTADWFSVGTVDDLGALSWDLAKRLELATAVGRILEALHQAGIMLGALRPDDVLFDDDLGPVLGAVTLPGSGDARDALYAAPEARSGTAPDARSDVFAFGQLLHFVLGGVDPEPSQDLVPLLAALKELPAGLSRIVRKATCLDPTMRYPSIGAMLADLERYGSLPEVGLAHADAEEPNKTGLSMRTGARRPPPCAPAAPAILPRSAPHPGLRVATVPLGERVRRFRASRAFKPFAAGSLALVTVCLIVGAAGLLGVGRRIEDARLASATDSERAELVASMHQGGRRDFAGQSMAAANLRKADLSHADLGGCDLSGADLGEANLAYANLAGAKLQGAKLQGADLTGATVDATLAAASAECNAQTRPPRAGSARAGTWSRPAPRARTRPTTPRTEPLCAQPPPSVKAKQVGSSTVDSSSVKPPPCASATRRQRWQPGSDLRLPAQDGGAAEPIEELVVLLGGHRGSGAVDADADAPALGGAAHAHGPSRRRPLEHVLGEHLQRMAHQRRVHRERGLGQRPCLQRHLERRCHHPRPRADGLGIGALLVADAGGGDDELQVRADDHHRAAHVVDEARRHLVSRALQLHQLGVAPPELPDHRPLGLRHAAGRPVLGRRGRAGRRGLHGPRGAGRDGLPAIAAAARDIAHQTIMQTGTSESRATWPGPDRPAIDMRPPASASATRSLRWSAPANRGLPAKVLVPTRGCLA
ncbi:MAG: pentapeptide repeat-containing protein [Polyangiaceae bacterium]